MSQNIIVDYFDAIKECPDKKCDMITQSAKHNTALKQRDNSGFINNSNHLFMCSA